MSEHIPGAGHSPASPALESDTPTVPEQESAAPEAEANSEKPACPNCHAPLLGQWCYNCGQSQKRVDIFFFTLVSEAFEDVLSWDSRTARTLVTLLFRPGVLTTEYFAGRRARYVPPFRLYIIASLLFFSVLSLQNLVGNQSAAIDTKDMKIQIGDTADDTGDWQEDLLAEIDKLNFANLTPEDNTALRERLKAQVSKALVTLEEDPGALLDALIDVAPPVMFILLPIFAFLLKIFYIGTGRYYTEHLVLAVHNHCFMYVILIFDGFVILLEDDLPLLGWVRGTIQFWIPLYMFLSLKRVYRQGWFFTFIKFGMLGISYFLLFIFSLLLAMLFGVMTL